MKLRSVNIFERDMRVEECHPSDKGESEEMPRGRRLRYIERQHSQIRMVCTGQRCFDSGCLCGLINVRNCLGNISSDYSTHWINL